LSRIYAELDALELTLAQCRTVAALASGKTITVAADAAGVSRPTLYSWLKPNGSPRVV
jgi:hypothetical protein